MTFSHTPVLLEECLDGLNINPTGIYVDCTLGGGGHSCEIVKRLQPGGMLIGIDQDKAAIETAKSRLSPWADLVNIVHSNFSEIDNVLSDLGIERIDGALMDIGVSSYQFDEKERGFSYRMEAQLDMRMDQRGSLTAHDLINNSSQQELEEIFWKYGEEKWGRRIAEFVLNARQEKPIDTTLELVEIIQNAIPKKARADGGHPAKRVFQALRIAVNAELDVLSAAVPKLVERLAPGGRLAIITFHSLEDRIVKNLFKELSTGCICPKDFPVCVCDHERKLKILTKKPITSSKEELELNPRSKSAKLRVAERV